MTKRIKITESDRQNIRSWSGVTYASTKLGYADRKMRVSLAKHAVKIIQEEVKRHCSKDDHVVICGVDNSSTAYGLETICLNNNYSFFSGNKYHSHQRINDYDYNNCLFFMIDDDIVSGRGLKYLVDQIKIAKCFPAGIYWIGISCLMTMKNPVRCPWQLGDLDWLLRINKFYDIGMNETYAGHEMKNIVLRNKE